MKNYQEIFKKDFVNSLWENLDFVKEMKKNKKNIQISLIISIIISSIGILLYFKKNWENIINKDDTSPYFLVAIILFLIINGLTYLFANDSEIKKRYIKETTKYFKKEVFLFDFFKLLKQKFEVTTNFKEELEKNLTPPPWSNYSFYEKMPSIKNKRIFMSENKSWEYFLTNFEYDMNYGFIINYDKISKGVERPNGCIIKNICMRFESH